MFSNITAGAFFATGIGATLLAKWGSIWNSLLKYIHIGYTITVDNETSYSLYYLLINKITQYKSSLNKSLSADLREQSVAFGTYIIKVKPLTYLCVSHERHLRENRFPIIILTIRIFGLQAKKIFNEYKEIAEKEYNKKGIVVTKTHTQSIIDYRSFDTIFSEQKKDIISFLDAFIKNKSIYKNNNLPYKTGILLYGVPGTGKTSIVKAIATYLNYNIMIVNAQNIPEVCNSKTIYLIEEIDKLINNCLNNSDSSNQNNQLTISAFMQLFDGIMSNDETIFVATTNHIELLPPELIRDGRFDLRIELTNISRDTAIKMCQNFGEEFLELIENEQFPINPAYLQGKILKKLHFNKDDNYE